MTLFLVSALSSACAGESRDQQAEKVGEVERKLEVTNGTLAQLEREAADAETTASSLEELIRTQASRVEALEQTAAVTTPPAPASTSTTVAGVELTDPGVLVAALDEVCQNSVGARARDASYDPFVAFFHQLETQQHALATQGLASFRPDAIGQAVTWNPAFQVCA